ncbi:unnamed protein product, partial [Mesorhabditis belari]|uniref:Uncharacterized protein n=1 Tax=Mesorhabditis belari TaxID=2138241 RepID=A0AAF3EIV1_9BILA
MLNLRKFMRISRNTKDGLDRLICKRKRGPQPTAIPTVTRAAPECTYVPTTPIDNDIGENKFFSYDSTVPWRPLNEHCADSTSYFLRKYNLYPFVTETPNQMDHLAPGDPMQNSRSASGVPASASGRHPLQTVNSTCFVPAKSTGIVSLCVQFVILVLSALTTIFFFYHVGGYEYMGWNENGTMLVSPINSSNLPPKFYDSLLLNEKANQTESEEVESLLRGSNVTEENDNNNNSTMLGYNEDESMVSRRAKRDAKREATSAMPLLDYEDNSTLSYDDKNEQLPNTSMYIGWIVNAEIDFLELIRISTLVYLALCAVWFLSLLCLVVAIKTEIPDLVVANMTICLISILYLIVHTLFIGIIIYLQITLSRHLSTKTFIIIISTMGGLFLLSIVGFFCIILDVGFYNHICYMNDSSGCICLSVIVNFIKGSRRNRRGPHEYALPENTRSPPHSNMPYADDPTPSGQQFSHF